jgi:hypothetical protein
MNAISVVAATPDEKAAPRPGDGIVYPADVVMNRAFTVDGTVADVWPWLAQLGKQRAGWYLPERLERLLPANRRATRDINPAWQTLSVGDVIPDYGGRHETFTVAAIDAPTSVVYSSRRRNTELTWSITLQPVSENPTAPRTRVYLRLRMAPIKHQRLANTIGELFDLLTVAGMAAGLRERVSRRSTATSRCGSSKT